MSGLREAILYIIIATLIATAGFQGGYILGKWQDFDRDGKIAKHETQIGILKSDMTLVKEKLRMK